MNFEINLLETKSSNLIIRNYFKVRAAHCKLQMRAPRSSPSAQPFSVTLSYCTPLHFSCGRTGATAAYRRSQWLSRF